MMPWRCTRSMWDSTYVVLWPLPNVTPNSELTKAISNLRLTVTVRPESQKLSETSGLLTVLFSTCTERKLLLLMGKVSCSFVLGKLTGSKVTKIPQYLLQSSGILVQIGVFYLYNADLSVPEKTLFWTLKWYQNVFHMIFRVLEVSVP